MKSISRPRTFGTVQPEGRRTSVHETTLHHVGINVSIVEHAVASWTPFLVLMGYSPDRWPDGSICCKQAAESRAGALKVTT